MTRYGMVINLDRCVGCAACAIGCTVQHGLPKDDRWSGVRQLMRGTFPDLVSIDLPTLCMHCKKPLCIAACGQNATYQRDDGIVLVDPEKCIGCGACAEACPYDARHTVDAVASNHAEGGPTPFEEHMFGAHVEKTTEKCTFCADRVDAGELPVCVKTCVSNARTFGDLDDPASDVAKLAANAQPLLAAEGTDPSVLYISSSTITLDEAFNEGMAI